MLQHVHTVKLTYISLERFMNEMINAVRYDRVIDFRERYRTVDVLCLPKTPSGANQHMPTGYLTMPWFGCPAGA